jgi:hypothetical protein
MELRMKEPRGKGIANHPGPESCAGGGNTMGEALTGVYTGQPLNSEMIDHFGVPTGMRSELLRDLANERS